MVQAVEKQSCQVRAVRRAQAEETGQSWGQGGVSTLCSKQAQDCATSSTWRAHYHPEVLFSHQRWCVSQRGCCLIGMRRMNGLQRFMPLALFWVFCHSSQLHEIIDYQNYTQVNSDNTALNICLDPCSSCDPYHFPSSVTYYSLSHSSNHRQRGSKTFQLSFLAQQNPVGSGFLIF